MPTDLATSDPMSMPLASVRIKHTTQQEKHDIATSYDLGGVVKTWDITTGLCKASFKIPAHDFSRGDTQLNDSGLIFVYWADQRIYIWDAENCELLQTINAPGHGIKGVRISGDRSKVFCQYRASIQAWSILTGKAVGEVGSISGGFLAVGGSRVWVRFPGVTSQGWDFGVPGSLPVPLSNTPTLHLNSTKLWDINLSTIRDTVTGKVFFQPPKRFVVPFDVQWNGQYLVVGYKSGEVLILDFDHVLPP